MGNHHDCFASFAQSREVIETLALEFFVAYCNDFIYQQNIGAHMHRNREAQPDIHATGVVLDRVINKVTQSTEVNDFVGGICDFFLDRPKMEPLSLMFSRPLISG